jgi:hypothetical protein
MLSISSKVLGSPQDLSFIEGRVAWSSDVTDAWVVGDPMSQASVDALFDITGKAPPHAIPEEYARSMDGIARGSIPWPLVIPQQVLGDHIRSIASDFEEMLEAVGDYADTLRTSRYVLSQLRSCRVDLAALRVEQGKGGSVTLDSFEPGPDSMCLPPVYSHATATGRLTVREGPRILTLHKDHRRILSSRFDGGRVMQVDFVSLEPRVLRLLANGSAPNDIYSDVAERIGGGATRRQVKLATLKMLYGSSRAGITEEVGQISLKSIRQIEEYFGLPSLRAKLSSELARSGAIKSYWGRPLREANEGHLLISHYTQSTAVDVALCGFGDLIRIFQSEDLDVVPCYVLHDALLLDVHPDAMGRLGEIVQEGIEIDGLGHFEVSLSPAYLEPEES